MSKDEKINRIKDVKVEKDRARGLVVLAKQQNNLADMKKVLSSVTAELASVMEERDLLASGLDSDYDPIKIAVSDTDKSERLPILVLSDTHIEERVDPKQVDGKNKHNLKIAELKHEKWASTAVKFIRQEQERGPCNRIVLAILGDLMSGHIHREFLEVCELTPTECVPELVRLLSSCIDFFLAEFDGEILIPCCGGNHGRDTIKRQIATGPKHCYETAVYQILAAHYRDNDRVTFSIATSPESVVSIGGYKIRVWHGDRIRYSGGIGGISVPLNRFIDRYGQGVDLDLLGHFHQFQLIQRRAIVNGSMIGYSPYAMWLGFPPEPPIQAMASVHLKTKRLVRVEPAYCDV